jgi:hypothetical protein
LYLRGVEFSTAITAPEAMAQVSILLQQDPPLPVVNEPPEPITTDEIRDLVWRMFNMFRAIFATDICGESAKNRATASVMRFLSLMEKLDLKLYPRRAKPIWIAKYNFTSLLRVCESFVHFKHVKNLYEGGVIGEAVVKVLRPLVAKGVHKNWATNLLLAHYRQCTLDLLIEEAEEKDRTPIPCPLGEDVESSKFKRYTTTAEVNFRITNGRPIPVLLYGSSHQWKAGVIIVAQKRWYFKEVVFLNNEEVVNDPFGLAYHQIHLPVDEILFGQINGEYTHRLGEFQLPFWDYGLLLPELVTNTRPFRYSLLRSSWQFLDANHQWSEHC